jgi:septal ring factor EnvC (AmiA/AmiB activator)
VIPWTSRLRRDRDGLARRCKDQQGDIERMTKSVARLHEMHRAVTDDRDDARQRLAVMTFERDNLQASLAEALLERDALAQRLAAVEARGAFDSLGRCADSVTCNGMRDRAQKWDQEHPVEPVPMWSTVWGVERAED